MGLTEERRLGTGVDPAELWRRWFETGTRVWADMLQGEGYSDPFGLYRQWFEGAEIARRQMMGATAANGTGARRKPIRGSCGAGGSTRV